MDQAGSTGLRVIWSRSAGHVDWYEVVLEDNSSGSTLSTRIMGTAAPQSGFTSLDPGTEYTVTVVASAGNKSAAPVRTSAVTGEKAHDLDCRSVNKETLCVNVFNACTAASSVTHTITQFC